MTWKEQLGLQDDKCCFQCVTGTPAMAQASHSKPWKTSVRDGENAIAFPSLSIYHCLSLVNKCLPATASRQLPWGLEPDTLSFNEE